MFEFHCDAAAGLSCPADPTILEITDRIPIIPAAQILEQRAVDVVRNKPHRSICHDDVNTPRVVTAGVIQSAGTGATAACGPTIR